MLDPRVLKDHLDLLYVKYPSVAIGHFKFSDFE